MEIVHGIAVAKDGVWIAGISDFVNASTWVDFLKWTTSAYMLSRGIAKASRVLEQ